MPLQGLRPPRPMTHDIFVEVVASLGAHLRRVEITDLIESTFHARLMLETDGQERSYDIRPSDAVALAVRTETPIFVAEAVFDQAGILSPQVSQAGACRRGRRGACRDGRRVEAHAVQGVHRVAGHR